MVGPLRLTGDVATAAAGMSPHVNKLREILPMSDLQKHLRKEIPSARHWNMRTFALIYCELATVLATVGLAPYKKDVDAVSLDELVDHLSSASSVSLLSVFRRISPLPEESRTSASGVRSQERRLVNELSPSAPVPRPAWWHDHYCKDAGSMLTYVRRFLPK